MSHRKTSLSSAALIVTALSVFPVGSALGESVMLKRMYAPGRVSYVESRMQLEQDMSGMPMPPMKFYITQLYGIWEKVESTDEGKTKVVMTFDRAARSTEAPMMGDVEFDTDDPDYEEAAPQLGTVLRPMIGMAMTMEVDKDGKVVSFSGMDAINKKISEEAVASMHWAQMKEEFTDDRGMETWGTSPLLIYPNKKVKVGDTWNANFSMERHMVGTLVTDYQYKVDRIGMESGRKIVSIVVTGVVSKGADAEEAQKKDDDAAKEEAKKNEPKVEVNGTISGTALYDVELGRIVKRSSDSKIDIKIPLSKLMPNVPPSEEPQIANFISTIKSTTLILTEKERNAQKAAAQKKALLRKQAEEEADEDDDEDDA